MTVEEILKLAMSENEDGEPESFIGLSIQLVDKTKEIDPENPDISTMDSVTTNEAKLDVRKYFDSVFVDLKFNSDIAVDLKKMYDVLEQYGREVDKDIPNIIPMLTLTIIPQSQQGHVFIMAHTPTMWALTGEEIGKPVSSIRMVFANEDFGFYNSPDVVVSDIDAEVDMEVNKREFANSEFEKRRQQRIENMRRIDADMDYGEWK